MIKRVLKATVSALMVSTLLLTAACGNNSANTSSTSSASSGTVKQEESTQAKKDPVQLTFATFNEWVTQGSGITEAFKMYEAATGNKITQEVYPNDQFQNLLKTKLATGDVPDFYAINCGEAYVPYTNLEPLSGPWVDKMVAPIKKNATRLSDGAVCMAYFSPLGYLGAVYNKEVFSKAGVKVPLMNYQQLLAACESIKKIGVDPIFLLGKEGWTAAQIIHDGGLYTLQNADIIAKIQKNQVKPSQVPEFVDMCKRFLALKPYLNKDFMSQPLATGIDAVVEGKAGMTILGDWYYSDVAKKYPDKVANLGVMPITLGDNYISATSSYDQHAFAVPSAAKNKDAAKEAINYFMQPEIFKVLIAPFEGGSPYEGYDISMNQWQKELAAMLKDNNIPLGNPWYTDLFGSSVDYGGASMGQAFQEIFAGKDINAALDDWYKEYAKVNAAKKTPGF